MKTTITTKVKGSGGYYIVDFSRGTNWVATGYLPKVQFTKEKAEIWASKQAKVYK